MCGIFGWIIVNKNSVIDREKGRYLTNLLVHRGPDACGYYESERCFLGHRRLKVVDLSDEANQPMFDNTGRYCIVFNGEIYNYPELRKELEMEGIRSRTKSDTEILLNSYIYWGRECLSKIEGMFAFAVYDRCEHSVFVCRDPLGQKPLYYTFQNDHFIFASELRCIINHPAVGKCLDAKNILKYHVYDVFPFDATPVLYVKKLMPGNFLELKNGTVSIHRYWDSMPGDNSVYMSLDDAMEHMDELLTRSLERHLRTDVPFGVLLSGGVDSSLVTCYARKVLGEQPLHTFSVAVDFLDFNESHIAKIVSERFGCESHIFTLSEDDVIDSMNVMFNHIDEPLADPGLINCHFISKKAREYITVALAGDGGDELFGGYLTFKAIPWLRRMHFLPERMVHLMVFLLRNIFSNKSSYMSLDFKLKQFVKGLSAKDLNRLPIWTASFTIGEINMLYHRDFLSKNNLEENELSDYVFSDLYREFEKLKMKPLEDIMLYQYQKYFLPEFVLAHTDRASMSVSLETRCPMLDSSIIEFANRLPLNLKIKNGRLKKILFDLLEHLDFPREVIRHPKQGFTFPVASWLRGRLKDRMIETLLQKKDESDVVWNRSYINKLVDEHLSGKANHYRLLWNLLVFSRWLDNYPDLKFL